MTLICKKCKTKYFDKAGDVFANCPECGGEFEEFIAKEKVIDK